MATLSAQHGVMSTAQFLDLEGVGRTTMQRAKAAGWLQQVTRRTLRIASSPETFLARCQAVSLEVGAVGFLSGQTAARLHGLRGMRTDRVEVTIPAGRRLKLPDWAGVGYTSWYSASDRDRGRDDLAVAAPTRMLFSLAATFNQYRFERAAEDAWHLALVSPREASDYLELHRCRGKNGVARMERWLERTLARNRPSQSGLELDLLAAIDRIGLPTPERQHPLTLVDGEVIHLDIAWPSVRLGVEPGASWWHGGDARQRLDQARDVACGEVGWQILRFDEQAVANAVSVVKRIRTVFDHRRAVADSQKLRG